MTEIRVAWPFGLHEDQFGNPSAGGVWFPDTPENRKDLQVIVESGCEVCGSGSHWREERDA